MATLLPAAPLLAGSSLSNALPRPSTPRSLQPAALAWQGVALVLPSSFLLENRGGREPPLTWDPEPLCLKSRVLSLGPERKVTEAGSW